MARRRADRIDSRGLHLQGPRICDFRGRRQLHPFAKGQRPTDRLRAAAVNGFARNFGDWEGARRPGREAIADAVGGVKLFGAFRGHEQHMAWTSIIIEPLLLDDRSGRAER